MGYKMLVMGDADAPYHPIGNVAGLSGLSESCEFTFSHDRSLFLKLKEFELCVSYLDAWERPLENEYSRALRAYIHSGGCLLHIHNGISLQTSPEMREALGARFTNHPPSAKLHIRPSRIHPVTEGVEDFAVFDEPYQYDIYGQLKILCVYEFEGASFPAAWESEYGAGKLVHLMPGHDASVFKNTEYQKLILNSIMYLIKEGSL